MAMNITSRRSFPRSDIIKEGQTFCKRGKLGVLNDCRLILRGYVAPFRLEVYPVDASGAGKVYSLERVKRVRHCGSSDHKAGLKMKFCGSICLYFAFDNMREADDWVGQIQMHSLATSKHVTLSNLDFRVNLMPNTNCHLSGYFVLNVTDDAVRLSDAAPRIVWPVHTIRFYGYREKFFSVATASCSETGEGVFLLEALSTRQSKLIYKCVAALVSRTLKVAAAAYWSPPRSSAPRLSDTIPFYGCSVDLATASAADSSSDGRASAAATSALPRVPSNNNQETLVLNGFYLKRLGMSVEKPTKAPEIYGLSQARREILRVFTSAQDPLERFPCGAILYGPSKCGKCLLVEEVSVQWSATLLSIPAECLLMLQREQDEGMQMLFDVAMAQAPCIILIKHLNSILTSSLSAAEAGLAFRVLQKIEHVFRAKKMRGVGFVGTIRDLSEVDLPLPSFHWMDRKIYVPPPCLETRHQVFQKELEDLLESSSSEGASCLSLLAKGTAGFDFVQLFDLYGDMRKVAVSDAFDGEESPNYRCEMRIRDLEKVKDVLTENASERKVYQMSGLSSAKYHARLQGGQERPIFFVKLETNEALSGVSYCFLQISDSSIDLCDLDPQQTIVSWLFTTIRQHSWTPLSFVLETGRTSATGEGEHQFETMEGNTICDQLSKVLLDKEIELDSAR